MDSPTPGRREIAHHLLDHAEQRLDLLTLAAGEVLGREHPQRDDRDTDLIAPLDELFELVGAGTVTRDERLPRSVGTRPAAIPVSEYGDVARQPVAVELVDQPMLIGRVQQP